MYLFDAKIFLGDEWLASSIAIAVTYIVFMLGIPSIFQIVNIDVIRNIYNRKLGQNRFRFFVFQIVLLIILFIQSNHLVFEWQAAFLPEELIFIFIILIILIILNGGYQFMILNFETTRNIEWHISNKVVTDAIYYYSIHGNLSLEDIDDLSTLARELPGGNVKAGFLNECNRLIVYILNSQFSHYSQVIEILQTALLPSIAYDGASFNHENCMKALDILYLTYNQSNNLQVFNDDTKSTYLNTTIGNCMKEIGVKAMMKRDMPAVMDAVEKLSTIESTAREMFVLGDEAITHGHGTTAVAVIKKLSGRVPRNFSSSKTLNIEDHRTVFFWLGLLSKLCLQKGAAEDFAQRQLRNVLKQFGENKTETQTLLKNAQLHFYVLADFSTIDALKALELSLFPDSPKMS